jgi:hypothetical protein
MKKKVVAKKMSVKRVSQTVDVNELLDQDLKSMPLRELDHYLDLNLSQGFGGFRGLSEEFDFSHLH